MQICKRFLLVGVGAALIKAAGILDPASAAPPPPDAEQRLVEQGRYLAAAGDCVSCHTRAHGEPFSGGRPLNTPFGVIYSANITADPKTGIGTWTEQQFARAMREGIAADGTHLYPAFPYTAYTKVTDQDVARDLRLSALAEACELPTAQEQDAVSVLGIRALLAGWNMMFFTARRYTFRTPRDRPNGIAARISRKASAIAGPVIRQGISLAASATPRR